MSVATTWNELLGELRADRAERERWLDEELRDLEPDESLASYRIVPVFCERAALLGSSGLLSYAPVLRERLPLSIEKLRRIAASDAPETLLWSLTHLSLCRATGVAIDDATEALAVRVIRDLGALADAFVDKMRLHALAIAAELGVVDAAEALSGGAPIDRSVEPGAVFQLNAQGFFRYVAAAIAARAPAEATTPAFREFVGCFPYKHGAGSLGFEHLFHAACAQARLASLAGPRIGDALHAAIVGEPAASLERRELAPDEVAEDLRGELPVYDWEPLLATVAAGADDRLATLRTMAANLGNVGSDGSIGDGLLAATELLARVAVTEGAERAKSVTRAFAPAMTRAIGDLQSGKADPRTLLGLLAHVHVAASVCAPTPPGFFDGLRITLLGALVEARTQLDEELRTLAGLMAIDAGRADLARAAIGPTDTAFRPGRRIERGPVLVGYLARALESGATSDDVRPAGDAFVATTPRRLSTTRAPWLAAILAHRACAVRFGGRPPHKVADELHAMVRRWAMARAQAEAEAQRAAVDPAAWWAIALYDLHGLYPGHTIHLKRDGEAWVQCTQGYASTRRFHTRVPPESIELLSAALVQHDLRRVALPARPGVPDESCPSLTLGAPGGTFTVTKWANDVDPAFDAIQAMLQSIAERIIAEGQPFFEGPYDHGWRPF